VKRERFCIVVLVIALCLVHASPSPVQFIPVHLPPAPPIPHGAPELDASLIGAGLAFLGAGLMLVTERFRKRSK
jgi:hypothetical protein